MKLKKTFQNPFALVVEGFVAGAIVFFATAAKDEPAPQGAQPVPQSAFTAKIFGA